MYIANNTKHGMCKIYYVFATIIQKKACKPNMYTLL